MSSPFVIGIPVYDGVDLLDVAVPYELFNWMAQLEPEVIPDAPQRQVRLVSLDGSHIKTRDKLPLGGELAALSADDHFDLLWIPGGDPLQLERLMLSQDKMALLLQVGSAAQYAASVCEGALLAAAAGLLNGRCATTHWAFLDYLQQFPQVQVAPGYPRYVVDGNRISGGGISSGLDEALQIIAMLSNDVVAGKVQLTVQYHPQPPFNQGDPSVATPPVYTPGEPTNIPGLAAAIATVVARQNQREVSPA